MILLIDNYDSFTWNLVHRIGEVDPSLVLERDLLVVRNDKISPAEADALDGGRGPSHVVISPGPCTPREAGISASMIEHFAGRVPVLGVCLGHQCIGELAGMRVVRHRLPMHGKTSMVHHDGRGVFAGLADPFEAMRYHSLVVDAGGLAEAGAGEDGWELSAWAEETIEDRSVRRVVMGLRRVWAEGGKAPLEGVQFHPESFMTPAGFALLANFLRMGPRARQAEVPRGAA